MTRDENNSSSDNREVDIPDEWLEAAIRARRAFGMDATDAAIEAVQYWLDSNTKVVFPRY